MSAWHQERTTTTISAYTLRLSRAYTTVIGRSVVVGLVAVPIVKIIAACTIAAIVLPSL